MVTDDPVGVGRGGALGVGRGELSVEVVVEALEETLAQVQVADGVDGVGEVHRARQLPVVVAPMVLDALQVPLVDKDHNLVALSTVDLLVQILIALVHEDLLQSREEDLGALDVPVDEVLVEALLGESAGAGAGDLLAVGHELLDPEGLVVLQALEHVEGHLHAGLVVETFSRQLVHLGAEELQVRAHLLSSLASILDLEAGEPELEFEAESEVELEGLVVEGPSGKEKELPGAPVVFEPLVALLVEVSLVAGKLLLRVDILKELRLVPPAMQRTILGGSHWMLTSGWSGRARCRA